MTPELIIRPEAESDIESARDLYEGERVGLGNRFLDSLRDCLSRIRDHPLAAQLVHKQIRRFNLTGFPYAVFYVVGPDSISVIACVHAKRHPRIWKSRV